MPNGYAALSEKEKETLRLIVRGHDAKSMARLLNLSVHTVNERLRDARRKMAVSSSREAARLLLDQEETCPQSLGDSRLGEVEGLQPMQAANGPQNGLGFRHRLSPAGKGATIMSIAFAAIALAMLPQLTPSPPTTAQAGERTSMSAVDAEVEASARRWLALLDQGRWDESYKGTGKAFQKLNTRQVWATISEKVRPPLGAALSRTLISVEDLPAPPRGYQVIKFRTRFANKPDAVETVTFDREEGGWRVVGVMIG